MAHAEFCFVNLPKLEDYSEQHTLARSLASKLRSLRLFALKTSPDAFGASYEVESQQGLDQTLERLGNPLADHFCVIDRPVNTTGRVTLGIEQLVEVEWLGMIVLNGPIQESVTGLISARSEPLAQNQQKDDGRAPEPPSEQKSSTLLSYHLSGTFVHPRARGGGVGRCLLEKALDKAKSEARKRDVGMRCTVLVDSENQPAQRLYENAGFRKVGEEAYVQQPRGEPNESRLDKAAWRLELNRHLADLQ